MRGKNRLCCGFTLIELVIVITIVGILATLGIRSYRVYVKGAMASEGKALLGAIANAERMYYAEAAGYSAVGSANPQSGTSSIPVDARQNTYFKGYSVTVAGSGSGASYTAVTTGSGDASGISITLIGTPLNSPQITESGLASGF